MEGGRKGGAWINWGGISSKSKKSGQRNRIVFAILAKKMAKNGENFSGHCNAQYQQIPFFLALQGCTTSIFFRFMFLGCARSCGQPASCSCWLFCLNHRQAKGKVVLVVVCLFVFCFVRKSFLFCFKRSSCSKKSLVGFFVYTSVI